MDLRNKCHLCGYSRRKLPHFKFPSDRVLRQKWNEFCGLSSSIQSKNFKLCVIHFSENNILTFPSRTVLKKNTLPTLFNKNISNRFRKSELTQYNIGMVNSLDDLRTSHNGLVETNVEASSSSVENLINSGVEARNSGETSLIYVDVEAFNTTENLIDSGIVQAPVECSPARNLIDSEVEVEVVVEEVISIENVTDLHVEYPDRSLVNLRTPIRKRRFRFPRVTSEVRTSDLETPEGREVALEVIRRENVEKTKRIQSLRRRTKRLQARIDNLESLVSHLEDKKYITENAANYIKVSTPKVIHDFIGRELKQKNKKKISQCNKKIVGMSKRKSSILYNRR